MSSDRRKISLVHNSKIKMMREGRYLIDGLIPQRDLTIAWGEPKSGKTFWALDVAFHIAMGKDYRGKKVQQGAVVYCAFEGQFGIRDRITAFHQVNAGSEDCPLWLMLSRVTFTKPSGQSIRKHRQVIEEIISNEIRPSLVVLDTLNRSLDGSESSDEDMTFYTKAAEEICDTFSCAVLIIHHCGINKERPRGHTSLTGTCACQIAIRKESSDDNRRAFSAQVEYIKDGPEGGKQYSYLNTIQIGSDLDGNIISSCVVEKGPDNFVAKAQKGDGDFVPPQAVTALRLLVPLMSRSDDGWAKMQDWKEVAIRSNMTTAKGVDAKRKAFYRAVDRLKECSKIEISGELVRAI